MLTAERYLDLFQLFLNLANINSHQFGQLTSIIEKIKIFDTDDFNENIEECKSIKEIIKILQKKLNVELLRKAFGDDLPEYLADLEKGCQELMSLMRDTTFTEDVPEITIKHHNEIRTIPSHTKKLSFKDKLNSLEPTVKQNTTSSIEQHINILARRPINPTDKYADKNSQAFITIIEKIKAYLGDPSYFAMNLRDILNFSNTLFFKKETDSIQSLQNVLIEYVHQSSSEEMQEAMMGRRAALLLGMLNTFVFNDFNSNLTTILGNPNRLIRLTTSTDQSFTLEPNISIYLKQDYLAIINFLNNLMDKYLSHEIDISNVLSDYLKKMYDQIVKEYTRNDLQGHLEFNKNINLTSAIIFLLKTIYVFQSYFYLYQSDEKINERIKESLDAIASLPEKYCSNLLALYSKYDIDSYNRLLDLYCYTYLVLHHLQIKNSDFLLDHFLTQFAAHKPAPGEYKYTEILYCQAAKITYLIEVLSLQKNTKVYEEARRFINYTMDEIFQNFQSTVTIAAMQKEFLSTEEIKYYIDSIEYMANMTPPQLSVEKFDWLLQFDLATDDLMVRSYLIRNFLKIMHLLADSKKLVDLINRTSIHDKLGNFHTFLQNKIALLLSEFVKARTSSLAEDENYIGSLRNTMHMLSQMREETLITSSDYTSLMNTIITNIFSLSPSTEQTAEKLYHITLETIQSTWSLIENHPAKAGIEYYQLITQALTAYYSYSSNFPDSFSEFGELSSILTPCIQTAIHFSKQEKTPELLSLFNTIMTPLLKWVNTFLLANKINPKIYEAVDFTLKQKDFFKHLTSFLIQHQKDAPLNEENQAQLAFLCQKVNLITFALPYQENQNTYSLDELQKLANVTERNRLLTNHPVLMSIPIEWSILHVEIQEYIYNKHVLLLASTDVNHLDAILNNIDNICRAIPRIGSDKKQDIFERIIPYPHSHAVLLETLLEFGLQTLEQETELLSNQGANPSLAIQRCMKIIKNICEYGSFSINSGNIDRAISVLNQFAAHVVNPQALCSEDRQLLLTTMTLYIHTAIKHSKLKFKDLTDCSFSADSKEMGEYEKAEAMNADLLKPCIATLYQFNEFSPILNPNALSALAHSSHYLDVLIDYYKYCSTLAHDPYSFDNPIFNKEQLYSFCERIELLSAKREVDDLKLWSYSDVDIANDLYFLYEEILHIHSAALTEEEKNNISTKLNTYEIFLQNHSNPQKRQKTETYIDSLGLFSGTSNIDKEEIFPQHKPQ